MCLIRVSCTKTVVALHLYSVLIHPAFLLSFPATLTPLRAILDGFTIRSVFSCLLVCMSEIVHFCVLYFSVMLLDLKFAIVHYTVSWPQLSHTLLHSYLTCLCFTILIDTGILPVNAFKWLLCITSKWGGYKTCSELTCSSWGCSSQLGSLVLMFSRIIFFSRILKHPYKLSLLQCMVPSQQSVESERKY